MPEVTDDTDAGLSFLILFVQTPSRTNDNRMKSEMRKGIILLLPAVGTLHFPCGRVQLSNGRNE